MQAHSQNKGELTARRLVITFVPTTSATTATGYGALHACQNTINGPALGPDCNVLHGLPRIR